MDNVLFVIDTPGSDEGRPRLALVPFQLVEDIDLVSINGLIVNVSRNYREKDADEVVKLYKRFGLEENDGPKDLEKYLEFSMPLVAHRVVFIGWAV